MGRAEQIYSANSPNDSASCGSLFVAELTPFKIRSSGRGVRTAGLQRTLLT